MAYTTLSEAKQYLGIKTNNDDELLQSLIDSAKGIIEKETHRVFEAAAATKTFDAVEDVDDRTLNVMTDLVSVTTLTNGDGVVIPSTEYVLIPANDTPKFAIRLKMASSYAWTYTTSPEGAISVNGYWGYSLTAPADISHISLRLVGFLYRQKDAQTFDVAGQDESRFWIPARLPADIRMVLERYRRVL